MKPLSGRFLCLIAVLLMAPVVSWATNYTINNNTGSSFYCVIKYTHDSGCQPEGQEAVTVAPHANACVTIPAGFTANIANVIYVSDQTKTCVVYRPSCGAPQQCVIPGLLIGCPKAVTLWVDNITLGIDCQ